MQKLLLALIMISSPILEKPLSSNIGNSILTVSIGSGAIVGGALASASSLIGLSIAATAGIGAAVAGLVAIIYAAVKLPGHFSEKALNERENQFEEFDKEIMSNDQGLGGIISDIMKQFNDKGWEPLNENDSPNIKYVLDYRSTASEEERKQKFYKRLYREMAIRCNRWWMKKAVNGNYIHSSWDTGYFIAIPEKFIIDNGAYCHLKGDISENPKE